MTSDVVLDVVRGERLGFGEAILCDAKSADQIATALEQAEGAGISMLLTRLDPAKLEALPASCRARLDYDERSRTAFFGPPAPRRTSGEVVVVTAGTSDTPVAREATRTLAFSGHQATEICDVGVAGLWRLQARIDDIGQHRVAIVAAGMDGALPTVLAGLFAGLVIAVPTSVGYGAAEHGRTALNSMLSSCAPGLAVVNIDNGYGAACVALRALP